MSVKSLLIVLSKLAASGALIALIAGLVLVVSDDGTVPEAQADLTDIMPGGPSDHHRFERVMERSGLQARPFDHNGNIVKFAVGESELSPAELMAYYQRELVREGVNSQIYHIPQVVLPDSSEETAELFEREETLDRNMAMLNGEVVPVYQSDNMMNMSGIVPKIMTEDPHDLLTKWKQRPNGAFDMRDNIASFRTIEARRDPHTGRSTVTASWSDPGFDAHKADGDTSRTGASPDKEIMFCRGCDRLNRLEGLSADDPYILNQFMSPATVDTNRQFYDASLARRGWEISPTLQILDEMRHHIPELDALQGDMLSYTRGDEMMNLYISDFGDGRSSIISIHGPAQ